MQPQITSALLQCLDGTPNLYIARTPRPNFFKKPLLLLGSQAVENVGTVMANILRTQGRMEDTSAKLQALKSEDATKFLSKRCVTVVLALL